jgi:D-tyrosyl-tRNA(Tyr) deacylase
MKFVIQRVSEAEVVVEQKSVGRIGKGFMVLVGISGEDTKEEADRMIRKMVQLRIFEDENGKTNLSLKDVGGSILLISQFTLYADAKRGNRPSFIQAARPEIASPLFDYIVDKTKETVPHVERGIFGADMKVSLVNDGPFTMILEDC